MPGYAPTFTGPADAETAAGLGSDLRRAAGSRRPAPPRRWLDGRRAAAASGRAAAARAGLGPGERLIRRATMGWTLADRARLDELGYDGWLDEQLDPRALDDSELEEALVRALPSLALSPAEIYQRYAERPFQPVFELMIAALFRALYSPRQLYERMIVFWSDHFNIHILSDLGFLLKPTDDREVVRRHALGRFPELLSASARSPAMLSYLTNDSNVKDHPNENYARELMELHTLGVDGGYTEKDVKEVARCFTGWTFRGRSGGADLGRFVFDPRQHDTGAKRVLGHTIPAGGGEEDGQRVLDILARRRATAKFVAEKLLRYFWGYQPKKAAIRQVADVYQRTGGDIRAMLRSVLRKKRMGRARPKLKRPFHLLVSSLRGLFAELRNPGYALEQLYVAGHLPFNWPPPNGYPDSEAYWSGFVLPRWNFASTFLAKSSRSAVVVDLPFLDPELPVAEIVDGIDRTLAGGALTAESRAALTGFLEAGARLDRQRIRDAIGLAVASPEFQEY